MELKLLIPPVTGCIIGWLTNYVAIKLLFRPHSPVKFFGFTFQGLIPKRRKEIARSIAQTIEAELLSSEDLASTLDGLDWQSEVEHSVEEVVEHRFGSEKLRSLPLVGLVSENLKYHLKYILTREIVRQIDRKKGALVDSFKNNMDVRELLVAKIDRLDVHRFEGLLTDFIARELKHLEWLGGLMGLLIGMAQSLILYFLM